MAKTTINLPASAFNTGSAIRVWNGSFSIPGTLTHSGSAVNLTQFLLNRVSATRQQIIVRVTGDLSTTYESSGSMLVRAGGATFGFNVADFATDADNPYLYRKDGDTKFRDMMAAFFTATPGAIRTTAGVLVISDAPLYIPATVGSTEMEARIGSTPMSGYIGTTKVFG